MGALMLVEPDKKYAEQVMEYRAALLAAGEPAIGCSGLDEAGTYEAWMTLRKRQERFLDSPAKLYLALRKDDSKVIGMSEIWTIQTLHVRTHNGNLKCSVLPGERGKGYGGEILEKTLGKCWEIGCDRLFAICGRDDSAANRMIVGCGGELNGEADDAGLCKYLLHARQVPLDSDDKYFDWYMEHWYRPNAKVDGVYHYFDSPKDKPWR